MMTPEQSRAARAWLNMSQAGLAKSAKVGISTVAEFESGRRVPIANNLDAMRRVFEASGVQLVFDEEGKAMGVTVRGDAHQVEAIRAAVSPGRGEDGR